MFTEIKMSDVKRAYFGRSGCMCGCRGNYHDTPRMIKRAVNKINATLRDEIILLIHKNTDRSDIVVFINDHINREDGHAYIDDGNRTCVVYFK